MVTLRTKQISGNRQRLYLDFYPPITHPETGKLTRREFLDLFLYNECEHEEKKYSTEKGNESKKYVQSLNKKGEAKKIKLTPLEKDHNEKTTELAESVRAQRQLEIQANNYGFLQTEKKHFDFLAFLKAEAEKRKAKNGGDKNNWMSLYQHFYNFTNGVCTGDTLTEQLCKDFKEHLKTTKPLIKTRLKLANNSMVHYFVIFKSAITKAFNEKHIKTNPCEKIESIERVETQREYLTLDELQKLVNTDCSYPILKQAALFSAMTGLRYSDIEKLVWGEIFEEKKEDRTIFTIRFTQQKTRGVETLPIPQQAFELLGDRKEANEKVFPGLLYSSWQNFIILEWVRNAKVNKHITFHNFRHTYATLQLTLGTDIYTVSKMLGHRDLKTTQVYAKIVDEKKREAAERIQLNFNK